MAVIKSPTDEELNAAFDPYVLELGRFVYAWNHLQESLAELFWRVTGIRNGMIPYAIWHSTPSDLAQRKMLRAVAEIALASDERALNDLTWLLDKVDHLLSPRRNNAIHAPVVIRTDETGTSIRSYDVTNNPRSKALSRKEITKELIWYRETAEALRLYARDLYRAMRPSRDQPWPDRPSLPHLGPQKIAKEKSQAKHRKGSQPRHRSSPK